ncbi:protein PELPK1-like [Vitis riparia]|uniref:protein PELPK1-like n=1 Tax=Vitis riparia TaxID=96939 RepID=UPI00155A06D1|nr:protein PELPK1-like [Vitis riparia]
MQTILRRKVLPSFRILNLLAIQKGKMAHHHDQSILLPLLLITLSLMSCKEVFASRHLLEETTLPKVPELPKPELPPLPTLPTFPKPELPPLPHIPTLPESTLPTLPKPELPTVPHVPALEKPEQSPLPKLDVPKLPEVPPLPHLPDLPKPTLPTVPTLPKDIPFPSLSPPHSTTSP